MKTYKIKTKMWKVLDTDVEVEQEVSEQEIKNLEIALDKAQIALDVAGDYDYCPDSSEAETIIEDLFDYDLEELRTILDQYKDYSFSALDSLVTEMTRKLKTQTYDNIPIIGFNNVHYIKAIKNNIT